MVNWLLKKILGSKNQREVRRLRPLVEQMNRIEQDYQALSDADLQAKSAAWKQELSAIHDPDLLAKRLNALLPEAFAAVKNTARRLLDKTSSVCDQPQVWNMIHFDVQLIGGIAIHQSKNAEMATGGGKTFVATFPPHLHRLSRRRA